MRWWRATMVALGVGVATTLGILGTPAAACACGAFLLPQDESVSVSQELAIISWDGREERILLTMDVDATSADAALLIPTPTPATVSIGDASAFTELATFTAPVVERADLWWPEWLVKVDLGTTGVNPVSPAPPTVPLGGVEAEVIGAEDADELQEWLQRNGVVLRDNVASALVPYIQQGWSFTLINLDAQVLQGRLQPIEIRFETNQVVYPMRLSVAGGPLRVNTYVFSDHRMERTDTMGGYLRWAGPVSQTDFASQALVDLARTHPFLTVWQQNFGDPRNQIDGDMVFAAASTDEPFVQTAVEVVRHEIFGMPAGPTLVFGGLILVGALGGGYSALSRRRRA